MKIIILIGSIFAPLLFYYVQAKWPSMRMIFNLLALLSAIVFGDLASIGIYQIIKDKTVFMTNIHGLFLNPFFLMTGAYLGLYFLYRLWILTFEEKSKEA